MIFNTLDIPGYLLRHSRAHQGTVAIALTNSARCIMLSYIKNCITIEEFVDGCPNPSLRRCAAADAMLTDIMARRITFAHNPGSMLREIKALLLKLSNIEHDALRTTIDEMLSNAMSVKEHAMYKICEDWHSWLDARGFMDCARYYSSKIAMLKTQPEYLENKVLVQHMSPKYSAINALVELAENSISWHAVIHKT